MTSCGVLLQRSSVRPAGLHKRLSRVSSRGDLEQTYDEATLSPDVVPRTYRTCPFLIMAIALCANDQETNGSVANFCRGRRKTLIGTSSGLSDRFELEPLIENLDRLG